MLRLADNSINATAAAALRASPLVRRLAVLELETAPPEPPEPPATPGLDDPIPF